MQYCGRAAPTPGEAPPAGGRTPRKPHADGQRRSRKTPVLVGDLGLRTTQQNTSNYSVTSVQKIRSQALGGRSVRISDGRGPGEKGPGMGLGSTQAAQGPRARSPSPQDRCVTRGSSCDCILGKKCALLVFTNTKVVLG